MSRRRFIVSGAAVVAGGALAAALRRGGTGRRPQGMTGSAYGPQSAQRGELGVPPAPPLGTVVLIHGGYWYPGYGLELMRPLAADLLARGYLVWNLDYRPAEGGSGWPYLLEDVAAGMDHLARLSEDHPVALDRVVVIGHSAGGQLALWSAGRAGLATGLPGANPVVRPRAVVAQAPVADLVAGARARLGGGAVGKFMGGGPDEVPDRYRAASPLDLVPLRVPLVLVHGTRDNLVPIGQSRAFVAAAGAAGDRVELATIDGADHFDLINPRHPAWTAVTDRLPDLLT